MPSSVRKIDKFAFKWCEKLVEVELNEGLQEINERAFSACRSLKRVKIPSTVKAIGKGAFSFCDHMVEVELPEGLQEIHEDAFNSCKSLQKIKIPSTCRVIGNCAFQNCHKLEVVELSSGLEEIQWGSFNACKALLRIKVPSSVRIIDRGSFYNCSKLAEVEFGFDSVQTSHCGADGSQEMELVELYDDAFKKCHSLRQVKVPTQSNLNEVVETFCRSGASIEMIKLILDSQQAKIHKHGIDWQKLAWSLTVNCLVRCNNHEQNFIKMWEAMLTAITSTAWADEELLQSLAEVKQKFFPEEHNTNWQMVCEEFVKLKGWWVDPYKSVYTFHFLVKYRIPERLSVIRVESWRTDIEVMLKESSRFDIINDKLVSYEREYCSLMLQLKDATTLLDLALWKSKLCQDTTVDGHDDDSLRQQCLITSGADVVMPNILSFFIDV